MDPLIEKVDFCCGLVGRVKGKGFFVMMPGGGGGGWSEWDLGFTG